MFLDTLWHDWDTVQMAKEKEARDEESARIAEEIKKEAELKAKREAAGVPMVKLV